MTDFVKLENLDGEYEITYQTIPQQKNWFEPGKGVAKIQNSRLTGEDAMGIKWDAKLDRTEKGKVLFQALLDPETSSRPDAGLMDEQGNMTRVAQSYEGVFNVTKNGSDVILSARIPRGQFLINVQLVKKS